MTSPGVCIILATGRDSPYLSEALDSVRQQTYENWELIVVDNGAEHPDLIADLIETDRRMSMVTIEHSATPGLARNVGVSLTSAPLVTFLDDDDVWLPERLETHVLEHQRHPDAPATFSGYWHMTADGEHFGQDWRSRQSTAAEILSGTTPTPLGPTLMIRRTHFLAIGGHSPELPILVDFELALRLAMRSDLRYIDQLLVGYRRHATNITSTAPENVFLRRRAMEEILRRQHWTAEGRGDQETARLIASRLHRFQREESYAAGVSAVRQLKRGRLRHAARNVVWGVTRGAGSMFAGMLVPLRARLGRRDAR